MTLYAYDGASAFDLAAAKRAGAILITGYIVGHPGGMDPINKARVAQIRAMGMGFLPNWERGAAYLVTCSRADGVAAGREAVAALRALGVPDDGTVACPFSWDTGIDPAKYPDCGVVADGIIEGLAGRYRFTAYGQGGLIDYFAKTHRLQSEGWLSASKSFPGYNAADTRVALVQKVGTPVAGTDQNIVTDPANIHAWWPDNSPYGADMALDPNDPVIVDLHKRLDSIYARIWECVAVAVNGDAQHPNSQAAIGPVVKQVAQQVQTIQTGGVDPVALAKAIADHIDLAAK